MTPRIDRLRRARTESGRRRPPLGGTRLPALIVAALLVALLGVGITALVTSGGSSMTISARFATAPGLYTGNAVDVLGMPVGTVTKITPGPKLRDRGHASARLDTDTGPG